MAVPIDRLVAPEPLNTLVEDPLAQVNSVSQLSDVQPTDWAFQALQSLVEPMAALPVIPTAPTEETGRRGGTNLQQD